MGVAAVIQLHLMQTHQWNKYRLIQRSHQRRATMYPRRLSLISCHLLWAALLVRLMSWAYIVILLYAAVTVVCFNPQGLPLFTNDVQTLRTQDTSDLPKFGVGYKMRNGVTA